MPPQRRRSASDPARAAAQRRLARELREIREGRRERILPESYTRKARESAVLVKFEKRKKEIFGDITAPKPFNSARSHKAIYFPEFPFTIDDVRDIMRRPEEDWFAMASVAGTAANITSKTGEKELNYNLKWSFLWYH